MEHVISMETSKGQDQSVLNETNQNQSIIANVESPLTKVERTNVGETSTGHAQLATLIQSVTVNEENKEISNARQERNEHGADLESKAKTYLKSLLDNDDQLIINTSEDFPSCPKVSPMLRNNERSKDYYDPKFVSFGPYHHEKDEVQATLKIKTKVMRNFILEHGKTIEDLYIKVRKLNDHARGCYVDGSTNSYGDEAFALMMLQDGCFILFFIEYRIHALQNDKEWQTPRNLDNLSLIFNRPGNWEIKYFNQDLLLLENQIPYKVLNVLMSNIYKQNEGVTMIKSYLYRLYWGEFQKENTQDEDEEEPLHLLGLLNTLISKRHDHVETMPKVVDYKNMAMDVTRYLQSFGSVSDLQAKGINFKSSNYISLLSALLKEKPKSVSLRDVDFRSGFFTGELKLPPLILHSHSLVYLTNLVAFELCGTTNYTVISYISFMNSLIANLEDVKALRSKRIILHSLSSDEGVFKMLKEISVTNNWQNFFIYQVVRQDIERHINNKLKIWIAEMRHKYFSQPWSVISLLAAILVIILSFLQTFYTINPRKA